jgi:uncharacterized protein YjbI with pentapeptide repeats
LKPRPIAVTALLAFVLAASLAFVSVGLAARSHVVRCVIRNGTSCPGAVLNNRNLHGAHLKGAHLQRAHLVHANLRGADLRGANLTHADLRRAYLVGANLSGANLSGANLAGANLAGARLQGARLSGAILTGVTGKIIGRPASLPSGWVLKGGHLTVATVVRRPPPIPLGTPGLTLSRGSGLLNINPFAVVPNASSYLAQRCDAAGSSCQAPVTIPNSGHSFTGLVNGTTYTIRLTAIGDGTVYANSATATATGTPLALVGLAAPSFTVSTGPGTITINPFAGVPHASSYAAERCDGAGTNCQNPVTIPSSGVSFSGLVNGTTSTIELTAIGDGSTYANSNTITHPVAPGATPLIIDTDIYNSVDDVGALATGFALQRIGQANVVAAIVNTRTTRPAVPTDSWQCVAAIGQFYRSTGTLLGSDTPNNGPNPTPPPPDFLAPCVSKGTPVAPPASAVATYRAALASQPNGSVVIASIGYFENLQALLNSGPDQYSALNGHDLVVQKVKMLVAEGGGYPADPTPHTNFSGNAAAAEFVAANWPTKLVWSGYEVGHAALAGSLLSTTQPARSPVRTAYEAFLAGPSKAYYTFDLTTVYHAILGASDPWMTESLPGTNAIVTTVGPTYGSNTFTAGPGTQSYLQLAPANVTGLQNSLNALLDTAP